MSTLLAALRDASWFDHPGRAGKYHVVVNDDHTEAACSRDQPTRDPRMLLAEFTAIPASDVPETDRCRRPGCRRRWPQTSPDVADALRYAERSVADPTLVEVEVAQWCVLTLADEVKRLSGELAASRRHANSLRGIIRG